MVTIVLLFNCEDTAMLTYLVKKIKEFTIYSDQLIRPRQTVKEIERTQFFMNFFGESE